MGGIHFKETNGCSLALYNVTDSNDNLGFGMDAHNGSGSDTNFNYLQDVFTLSAQKVIRIRYYAQDANHRSSATVAIGQSGKFMIWKL